MDAMTALLTRRSTRNYLPRPVEREKLDKLLAAARQAPSGGNNQTNHFLVIQNRDVLDKLVSMTESAFAEMEVDEDTYTRIKLACGSPESLPQPVPLKQCADDKKGAARKMNP